ncbi:hypothetical protein Ancab_033142 [Ancistrocladus abbreviatus]
MVSGSTSGSYELRSRTVYKFPLHQLKARRLAELRKRLSSLVWFHSNLLLSLRGKVDKWDALTEEEKKELDEDLGNTYAEQCLMCSTWALKHFNKTSRAKRGLQYELVEALGSKLFIMRSLNYHCNFRAKPKGTPDIKTKLFFAEFVGRKVSCCCILDSGDPSSLGRCRAILCQPVILHPLDGFHYVR